MVNRSAQGHLVVTRQRNGANGSDGTSVLAQYSKDKSSWHSAFQTDDVWMRTSSDNGKTWNDPMRIVGESGTNGSYWNYEFGISKQLTTANVNTAPAISGSWRDAPIATTTDYPYLWMKATFINSEGQQEGTSKYTRLTGESGVSVLAQYSKDKSSWHAAFADGDQWMRTSKDSGATWGEPMKIVGEAGTNGSYTDYSFGISASLTTDSVTTAPAVKDNKWNDAPVATETAYPYLWMKMVPVAKDGTQGTATYVRVTGEKGASGTSVLAQYSKDKTNWHTPFQADDIWMRTSTDNGTTWTDAVRIVGEAGTNGSYTDYSFGISAQLTTASVTTAPVIFGGSWQDAPRATTSAYPYLWMRMIKVDKAGNKGTPTYTRLTGEKGADGTSVTIKGTVAGWWETKTSGSYDKIDCPLIAVINPHCIYWWDEGMEAYQTETPKAGDGYVLSNKDSQYDGHLLVSNGSKWIDAGPIKGEDGASWFLHIAYADSSDGSEGFTTDDSKADGKIYIGTYTDNNQVDSEDYQSYTWKRFRGSDGDNGSYWDYDFGISKQLTTASVTTAPYIATGWHDAPIAPTTDYPYLWMRSRFFNKDGKQEGSTCYTRVTGEKGASGNSVMAQYSADKTNWHSKYQTGDIWMRTSTDSGVTWSEAMRIVGESGKSPITIYRNSFDVPTKPEGSSPAGWSETPTAQTDITIDHQGMWQKGYDGYFKCPTLGDGESNTQVLSFRTSIANQKVYVQLKVNSEEGYDTLSASEADSSNGKDAITGTETLLLEYTIASPGAHTINIKYEKDGSNSVDGEYAKYKAGRMQTWFSKALSFDDDGKPLTWSDPVQLTAETQEMANEANTNLLNQTAFDASKMDAWEEKNGAVVTDGTGGRNAYQADANPESNDKEMLRQTVYTPNGHMAIKASKWYTLSFWAKAKPYHDFTIGTTSPNYGFATKTVYLEGGRQCTLTVNGKINSTASSAGRYLKVFIYKAGWTWSESISGIKTTYNSSQTVTFTPPSSGQYMISAYVYPNTSDGQPTAAQATVNWYRLDRGKTLNTYLYPSKTPQSTFTAIDTEAGCVKDGVTLATINTDAGAVWALSEAWTKHTFTFKTRATIPSSLHYFLFRLSEGSNGAYVCMPKLEEGTAATAYCESRDDMKGEKGDPGQPGSQGLQGCILRTSELQAGVVYRNDEQLTSGTRYLDIGIVTTGATTFRAFKCLKTHVYNTSPTYITYENGEYWQEFNDMQPIYTPLIMAQNALLRFTQTNQLLVMKSDGTTVAAGMGGGSYPLWIGATTPTGAAFKVSIDGKLYSTDAEITGKISATSGSIGGYSIGTYTISSTNGKFSINSSTGAATIGGMSVASNGDVTINNLTAKAGTFNGTIVSRGLGLSFQSIPGTNGVGVLDNLHGFFVTKMSDSSYYDLYLYLPANPHDGQLMIVVNNNTADRPSTLYAQGGKSIKYKGRVVSSYSINKNYAAIVTYDTAESTWHVLAME